MEHDTLRPPEAPSRRRLVRTPDDKVVAGVCGGLGRYFDIDPVVFRIGFAALTLAGGSGVLLYVVAWLAVPEQGRRGSIGGELVHKGPHGSAVGIALLVLAAVIVLGNLFDGGIGTAALLIAAGVALLVWRRDDTDRHDDGDDLDDGADLADLDDPGDVTSTGFVVYRRESRPRGPRSYLGRITFGVILIMAGGFAAGHASGAFDASVETFLAASLLVTGLALVVGSRFGRARGLIPLGVLLVVLTAGAAFVDVPLRGGLGDRLYQPASRAELREEYRLLAGQLVVDLTRVPLGEGTTEIEASVAAGELIVRVPRRGDVLVTAEVAAGESEVFGTIDDGVGLDVRNEDTAAGSARLELRLQVGAGRVEVERAAA